MLPSSNETIDELRERVNYSNDLKVTIDFFSFSKYQLLPSFFIFPEAGGEVSFHVQRSNLASRVLSTL